MRRRIPSTAGPTARGSLSAHLVDRAGGKRQRLPAGSLPVAWEVMAEDPFACLRTSAASAVSNQLRAAFRLPATFLRASGHLPPLEWLVLWPERSKISSSCFG